MLNLRLAAPTLQCHRDVLQMVLVRDDKQLMLNDILWASLEDWPLHAFTKLPNGIACCISSQNALQLMHVHIAIAAFEPANTGRLIQTEASRTYNCELTFIVLNHDNV